MNSLLLPQNHHFLSTSQDMRQLCTPLFKKFGINLFVYGKYYQNGSCILLSNNEDWMQYHLAKEYPVPAPIPVHLLEKPEAFHIISATGPFQKARYDLNQKYNTEQAVDFIKRSKDFYEVICFVFPQGYQDVMNTIINNLTEFRDFYFIFKDQASRLLKNAENHKISLPAHMTGIDFKTVSATDRYVLTPEILSKRQLDCASLLLQGKKYKEIANLLHISPRTVETHLNLIRNKLDCTNTIDLIMKLSTFLRKDGQIN